MSHRRSSRRWIRVVAEARIKDVDALQKVKGYHVTGVWDRRAMTSSQCYCHFHRYHHSNVTTIWVTSQQLHIWNESEMRTKKSRVPRRSPARSWFPRGLSLALEISWAWDQMTFWCSAWCADSALCAPDRTSGRWLCTLRARLWMKNDWTVGMNVERNLFSCFLTRFLLRSMKSRQRSERLWY